MQPDLPATRLNEQQLDIIRLFETPMPEKDFLQIRRLVVQLLAKKLDNEMERLEKEKGRTRETYEQ